MEMVSLNSLSYIHELGVYFDLFGSSLDIVP
jgi:hypothetical protein